jgi:hypothetical protein
MATGDRPIFPLTNQRLDKADLEAISDLVGENIMRTVGALLGPCGGLLSDVVATYDNTVGTVTIGACRLGYAALATDSNVVIDGGVVRWDPTYVAGGDAVDISSFGTAEGDDGYIFFRRSELEYDEDNRAYYDALAQEKKVGVANTRSREIAEFGTALTYDGLLRSEGWFPFLYVKFTNPSGVPSIYKISAFDGFGGGVDNAGLARAFGGDVGLGVDWDEGYVGIARLFREALGSIQHAYDSDFALDSQGSITSGISEQAYRWTGYALPRGLKQLNADLATAETALTSIESDVNNIVSTTVEDTDTLKSSYPKTATLFVAEVDTDAEEHTYTSALLANPLISITYGTTGVTVFDFYSDGSSYISYNTVAVLLSAEGTGGSGSIRFVHYEWTSTHQLTIRIKDSTGSAIEGKFSMCLINKTGNPWNYLST